MYCYEHRTVNIINPESYTVTFSFPLVSTYQDYDDLQNIMIVEVSLNTHAQRKKYGQLYKYIQRLQNRKSI